MDAGRKMNILLRLLDCFGSLPQRNSRRKIERQRNDRKLSLMVDRQRGIRSFEVAEGGERNLLPATGVDIDVSECVRILRKLRFDFQHNVILVQLRKNRRDLPLPKSIIERVVDRLRQDAKPRCGVTIDDQFSLEAPILLISGD